MNNNQVVYEYNKYVCSIDNIVNTINQYGVAIIPNMINHIAFPDDDASSIRNLENVLIMLYIL